VIIIIFSNSLQTSTTRRIYWSTWLLSDRKCRSCCFNRCVSGACRRHV